MPYTSPTESLETEFSDRVLTITLNRPEALNAFRPEMLEGIAALVKQAGTDPEVAVIVLQGAGRAFCAGMDLKVLQGAQRKAGKIGDAFDQAAIAAWQQIRLCPRPVIAKVHGVCITGGLEIALHCDLIYTTVDARFADTHTKFGLRPTWGMSQTLAQAVGVRQAKEMSFTARFVSGEEAVALGLANAACANKDDLDALVAERAAQIAANSQGAVAAFKDLYSLAQSGLEITEALRQELSRDYPDITDTDERLAGFS